MKILFITPYPKAQAPSQRFRFEQYFRALEEQQIYYDFAPFLSLKAWLVIYNQGSTLKKVSSVLTGYLRRFSLLFSLKQYDFIFIHREATPVGPPLFEWLIAKLLRKKIIYDFDDAIWLSNTSDQNKIVARLKWHHKVKAICEWSYKVSCGNQYLADYALQWNKDVIVNPTTIDLTYQENRLKEFSSKEKITIGWTGSHSTLKYLEYLEEALVEIVNKSVELVVISNQPPTLSFPYRFIKWSKETEVSDLLQFDIGIMPLVEDEWSSGKCGFKILQYMSLGIPAVASPVGVNKIMIRETKNGLLASSKEEWQQKLQLLIEDQTLRDSMGREGYRFVKSHYSTEANTKNFLSLFH